MNKRIGSTIANDSDRLMPKAQKNWDWRAAANFIAGGAGGSLVFFTAWATLGGAGFIVPLLLGLALVGCGLLCVWFEIGRPWRALNVFLHPSTSWMTREATVGTLLFVSGFAALVSGAGVLVWLSALLGAAFLYAQARILANNKGIPAWRHRRCLPLVVSTGLAEGAGFLAVVLALQGASGAWLAALLLVLVCVRYLAWRTYRIGLVSDGAPAGTLDALREIANRFTLIGHAAPALLLAIGLTGFLISPAWAAALAGLAVVAAGWDLKYTLVRRAAFTQGLSLAHLPIRGTGVAGPAVRPGWKGLPGQGA